MLRAKHRFNRRNPSLALSFSLSKKNQKVVFHHPALQFDSGGLGKGFAVDLVINYLKDKGVKRALVSIGESSIATLQPPPGKKAWSLLFQFPGEESLGKVKLAGKSLSGSATLSSSFTIGTRSYGHIVDPFSGIPLQKDIRVAVVHPSATEAEIWSKAIAIHAARKSLSELDLSSLDFYLKSDDGEVKMSNGMQGMLSPFTKG